MIAVVIPCPSRGPSRETLANIHRGLFLIYLLTSLDSLLKDVKFGQTYSWLCELTENVNKITERGGLLQAKTHTQKRKVLCQLARNKPYTNKKIKKWPQVHVTTLSHTTPNWWYSVLRLVQRLHPCSSVVGALRYGMNLEPSVPHDFSIYPWLSDCSSQTC